MFLLYLILSKLSVTERKIDFGFDNISQLKTSAFKRAYKTNDYIELRSSGDGGSLITFQDQNQIDDWSIEFDIDLVKLSYPQRAGFYVWYTNHEIEDGYFNGSHGQFVGTMVGLELLGKSLFLVLSNNDGEYDYAKVEDHTITTAIDSINPERFRNVDKIKFKLISTPNNFRVELFDKNNDNMLYDNFRYTNIEQLGNLKKGQYFSITTAYDKVPLNTHFNLRGVRLYERIESDDYDAYIKQSKTVEDKSRWPHEINHSSNEIRHLIANVENFIKYMKSHIGEPAGITMFKGLFDTHYEIQMLGMKIEEIKHVIEQKVKEPGENTKTLISKHDSIKRGVSYLENSIDEIETYMRTFEENHGLRISYLMLMMVGGVLFLSFFSLYQYLTSKKAQKDTY